MTVQLVRQFIMSKFPLAKSSAVADDYSLLENGIVDSLGILDIVGFVENEFKIVVTDEEHLPENFQSIQSIAGFIDLKKSVPGTGA